MLSRNSMLNGEYLEFHHQLLTESLCWSKEQMLESMELTLKRRKPGSPVWVFAYGSLMWNPALTIEEIQQARLVGWQRSFCIKLISGRASPECPGRMLALDKGDYTDGLIFRIPEGELEKELSLLWLREMITGLYRPEWAEAILNSGDKVDVLVFVADPIHTHYESDSSPSTVAQRVAYAEGYIGTNADYIRQLDQTLKMWNINDDYVHKIADILVNPAPVQLQV